jgi:3-hydroxyisobutyrate dehydrogenase-like beta-hydroxyacid dehydrogenase
MHVSKPVGLIGIGLLGVALARRLLDSGYAVIGFDIEPKKCTEFEKLGGKAAESITEIAGCCSRVLVAVLTIAQVEEVLEGEDGLIAGLQPSDEPRIALCTTTCEPDRIEALATRAAPHGLVLVDAPVSGTSQQVVRGEGVGLIGGEITAIKAAEDIIGIIYPRSYITGSIGTGTKTKLAINHILGLNRLALAEGLVFAERLGLDKSKFLNIARDSAAYSQIMDIKGSKMIIGDYAPISRVTQHLKDVRIILEQAKRCGQLLPMALVLADVLESSERYGEGEQDNAIIIEEIRRRGTR